MLAMERGEEELIRKENCFLRKECQKYKKIIFLLNEMNVLSENTFFRCKCHSIFDTFLNKWFQFGQQLQELKTRDEVCDPWPQKDATDVIEVVANCKQLLSKREPKRKAKRKERKAEKERKENEKQVFLSRTKRLQCQWPGCDAMFRDREDLENHKWRHTGNKLYACDWPGCQKSFSSRCYLKKHHSTHENPHVFKCLHQQCQHAFVTSAELNAHFAEHHSARKPFRCEFADCGQEFAVKRNLKDHQIVHIDEKRFTCDWPGCEAAFKRKQQKDIHMTEIHTTEAKLTCDWPGCDSAFSSHNKLRIHKMKHTGEKPYKCSQCEWRFRQKNHLKTHLLKHSGEKPFSCQHCDRRFQTKQSLRIHCHKSHPSIA